MEIVSSTRYVERLFRGLRLAAGEIERGEFHDCHFAECSLAEAAFSRCRFVDCRFRDCDLSLIQVTATAFSTTRFEKCRIIGVDWTRADWGGVLLGVPLSFRECAISHSTFIGLHLRGSVIRDCAAVNVDFREADLREADLRGTDFSDSLFGRTDLCRADLRGARNYQIAAAQNTVTGARFSLPEALSLLYGLDIVLEDEEADADDS